ncbi:cytochrome c oxidase, subunit III [mine drainage metagenome]|uniref:cytochrome-c oxidase n=1 Tax=mine drainage metagenome TaxID=410659 RepID=T1AWJ6_9ZZZZ
MSQQAGAYYIPHGSRWPIIAAVGLFTLMWGAAHWLDGIEPEGPILFFLGVAIIIFMKFGWFGEVIRESRSGAYSSQVDLSFRLGMMWFIFSEVMFFGAFFGALFYSRGLQVPWLSGEGHGALTNYYLFRGYTGGWPTAGFFFFFFPIAHHALRDGHRRRMLVFLAATPILGALFLWFQAHEYIDAYTHLNLTLHSGIYGATFFLLTGFHGLHVTLGTIMLLVILYRTWRGHFSKEHHFAFEAVAWYWHFVDIVWLALFLFVYIM